MLTPDKSDFTWPRVAVGLAFGSAVAILFSIAVCQILLGGAIVALYFSRTPARAPRIWIPLVLFLLGTLLSLFVMSNLRVGYPQLKKMFVFMELVVVFSLLKDLDLLRKLFYCWGAFGAAESLYGMAQFFFRTRQLRPPGVSFYDYYLNHRITGFTHHWMTYSGKEMIALLMLAALVFFAPRPKRFPWLWPVCAGLMIAGLVLGNTRGVWGAGGVAGLYLLWNWKRWLVPVAPFAAALVIWVSPAVVRERVVSIVRPGVADSNEFRHVMRRIGVQMISAHPLLGVGPEQISRQYRNYIPADIDAAHLPDGFYGHLHNIYLQYAAERGIPTALAMMALIAMALFDFLRGVRKLPPGPGNARFLLHGAVAVIIAILVEGWTEHNLGDSEVLTMFLVVVAAGYVALERMKTDAEPAR